jgi:hypothetical protein
LLERGHVVRERRRVLHAYVYRRTLRLGRPFDDDDVQGALGAVYRRLLRWAYLRIGDLSLNTRARC